MVVANRPPSEVFVELFPVFGARIGARNRVRNKFIGLSPVIGELAHGFCRAPARGLGHGGHARRPLLANEMKREAMRDGLWGHRGMSPDLGAGGEASRRGARATIAY